MQALARELNLSETTFLLRAEGDATAGLRIFTPRRELPFAGHPVVGLGLRHRPLDAAREPCASRPASGRSTSTSSARAASSPAA